MLFSESHGSISIRSAEDGSARALSPSPLQIISLTRLKGRNNPFQPLAVILYLPSPIIPYFAWGRYLGSTGIEGKYGVVDNKCREMRVLRRGETEKKKK